ncbi:MAG TPA: RluA family pseudouridine synthase [Ktedonobacteraceae bacterium]|nr:RluA family pseudouridine synthase [Ktedonobacteraceae bacterium]
MSEEQAGQRLDHFLVAALDGISRTAVQRMISAGQALVNGRASKAGYLLRSGDTVAISALQSERHAPEIQPQPTPLAIVYEDQDLLVVNKPAGMVVHPARGHFGDTLLDMLLARYPEMGQFGDSERPGIVHRLDKDTSGLLIVAKNMRAQAALVEQMKQHAIIKRYLALVEGVVALDAGSIDAPIGRDPRYRQQMAITTASSREARTHFRIVQRFSRHTLLLLQLETGRTHQIRVHLQAIGYPVVGDPVYGPTGKHDTLPLSRQFLHAYQLAFNHPITGQRIELEAPLPKDLEQILQNSSL